MIGRLSLAPADRRRIREFAETGWPQEACGLLEGSEMNGRVDVRLVHRLDNLADAPRRRYLIDPEAYLRLEHAAGARGHAIVGVWHSHPHGDPEPSARDLADAWPGWSYLIAGVTNGVMNALGCWRLHEGKFVQQPVVRRGSGP